MLSPTYEITTALSHTDELISPPYDIAIVTISYGRVTMSSVWDSMMSKKNMGWPFYAAVLSCPSLPRLIFFLPIPAPIFPILFRVPPPKIQIFCPRPCPSDPRPRPFFVKRPPTPAPITPGPRPPCPPPPSCPVIACWHGTSQTWVNSLRPKQHRAC